MIEYTFVGGPLDGQILEYNGTASWFGGKYDKDGIKGEYNTRVTKTYQQVPYGLYWWEEGTPRELNPDWEISTDVLIEANVEGMQEHLSELIRQADESTE